MKAKKSYGQHFLNSNAIAERIALSLQLGGEAYSRIVEVGPGRGMLTQFLLQRPEQLLVIEADPDMVLYLNKHYEALRSHIVGADFLRVDLPALNEHQPFGLIGNFPYNISSQILFKMVDNRHLIPEMVGMFQKEVAERVVAGPGSKAYGVISVLVQAYYSGEYLFGVDKSKFSPPPKVQSAVIRLTRKAEQQLPCDEGLFKHIVKQAFSQRRKMLRNTMKGLLRDSPLLQEPIFNERPEQLSLHDFIQLTRWVSQHRGQD
ncbi:16S rRNA (adenine(1518)-N(6)/adenine(1519)-N(6))-dimethyltransferase RsmA [Phaeodactylibacter luteus]|uniref:Ribosomal RNA small subunit methyltransferase A n=1 Tax=Phaeodactylibacter luteus TaxID=1564516 RepID=A0A5C6RKY2_9BACT|nr:16S rRNA (adenine(1518)-N(6)/adenine(1519)-N(6))-dimethyltransferase RsmA [Phaeodactylibacter luteus]TXB62897.1 16S rRNA (adenine(1518)-N(6)/adenine(1519)-N(6))-dimethyltransferase RsmA [Phaeodactylibacter luteus]